MPLKDKMPSPGGQNGSFRSPALRLPEDERTAFGKAHQKGVALKGCTKGALRVHQGFTALQRTYCQRVARLKGRKSAGCTLFLKNFYIYTYKSAPLSHSAVNIQFSRVCFRKKGYTPTQMPFLSLPCIRQVLVTQGIAERVSLGAPLVYPW